MESSKWQRALIIVSLIFAGEAIFTLPYHVTRFFRPTFLEVFELSATELVRVTGKRAMERLGYVCLDPVSGAMAVTAAHAPLSNVFFPGQFYPVLQSSADSGIGAPDAYNDGEGGR